MPLIWNPGGGGGISTVHTDNVTILGDGSVATPIAIKQVEHDTTISGAGTVASPLSVVGHSAPMVFGASTGSVTNATANQLVLYGFALPNLCIFTTIQLYIVAVGVSLSDVGIYNAAGTLVANAGAQVFGSTGTVAITLAQGTVTAQPGLYFFAFTSAANVFSIIDGGNNTLALYRNTAFGTSAAGALPATITPPALGAPSLGGPWFNLF